MTRIETPGRPIQTTESDAVTEGGPSPRVEAFVRRLLATNDEFHRRALIEKHRLTPADARAALLRLDDEAVRLHGVDPHRMERICIDAHALAEQTRDAYMQAMARMHHGDALRAQGQNAAALELYDEAARIFTSLGCPVEAARTRIGWVWAAAALGRYSEALAASRRARQVFIAHREMYRAANMDLVTGNIYGFQSRYRSAADWFGRTLNRYAALQEHDHQGIGLALAWCHANRGRALNNLGRHDAAIAELELARETFARLGEAVSAARAMRNIGQTRMELGRYAAALRNLEAARSSFRVLGLHHEALEVGYHVADCYLRLNRPADTIAALDEAESDRDRTDDSLEVTTGLATRRVVALLQLDRRTDALSELDNVEERAAAGPLEHQAWFAFQRAATLLSESRATEALPAAQRARDLARAAGVRRLIADASILEGMAFLELGQMEEAGRAAARARRLASAVGTAPLLHRVHELIGRVAESRSKSNLARRHYREAIGHLEREQRGVIFEFRDSFATSRGAAYERLSALELMAGRPDEALHMAERAKSRALVDALHGALELRPRGSSTARRLMRELAAARRKYAGAYTRAIQHEDVPTGASPERASDVLDLTRIERQITALTRTIQLTGGSDDIAEIYGAEPAVLPAPPDGTALIEYYFCGDDILRFSVDRSGIAGRTLAGVVPTIERLLRTLRLNLDATERAAPDMRGRLVGQAQQVLGRLFEHLMGDIDGLDAYRSLVIVPHGLLHYLPFHALYDGECYLVQRFDISYAPSAAVYNVCCSRARRAPPRGGALILAHSSNGRLPFAIEEAAAVARVLGSSVYEEEAATRGRLETEGRRAGVIHIAAHGQFRPDAPLFSHVELADGPLTTADAFNLDLRAALVTLSACETGRAVLGGGDELAGLARAFLYAGATGLLLSQWRVDDAVTSALMTHFYEGLASGRGAAAALRAAQVACISADTHNGGHQHPFYWAGFQITGGDQVLQRRHVIDRTRRTQP
jgi:tetratricopeptide (TPR) repeat protein